MCVSQAILHWEEVAKKHWLELWRRCYWLKSLQCQQEVCCSLPPTTASSMCMCAPQEGAAAHCVQRLVRGAFTKWVQRTELRATGRRQLQLAAEHKALKLERTGWKAWRMV